MDQFIMQYEYVPKGPWLSSKSPCPLWPSWKVCPHKDISGPTKLSLVFTDKISRGSRREEIVHRTAALLLCCSAGDVTLHHSKCGHRSGAELKVKRSVCQAALHFSPHLCPRALGSACGNPTNRVHRSSAHWGGNHLTFILIVTPPISRRLWHLWRLSSALIS